MTGGALVASSGLTNQAGGNLNVAGGTLAAPGGLTNLGTVNVTKGGLIDPPTFTNGGILNIDSTSTFVVGMGTPTGSGYVQLANGTLNEVIGSSAFGQIKVAGNASLDGTLDIMLQGGFNPAVGTTYDIILFSPGGLSGTFYGILNQVFNHGTEYWQVNYDNTNGYVQLTTEVNPTIPEPGTFLLLGSGLIGIAYNVCRPWSK